MVQIRNARQRDSSSIGRIIRDQSTHFLVDPDGPEAKRFFASLEPSAVEKSMSEPARRYCVAEDSGIVIGMIMIRDNNYISQFFATGACQGKGTGNLLWRRARDLAVSAGSNGEFKVDSSLIAQPVYERFGFYPVGEPTVQNGFKFISMHRPGTSAA